MKTLLEKTINETGEEGMKQAKAMGEKKPK
jgi:hypothetical protein